jgi:hypothetical protein
VAAAQDATTTPEGVMPAGRVFRYVCAAVLCLSLVGCSKEGPTGPPGPQGKPGAGTRIVYEGTVSAEAITPSGQVISVPELDLSSFPLVAVYVTDEYGDWFQCNLYSADIDPATETPILNKLEMAYLRNGAIFLYSEYVGHPYRIVIVK